MTWEAFLVRWAGRRWRWGEADCVCFAADWARCLTGADPIAEWRGRWRDRAGAEAVIAEGGGLAAMLARVAALAPDAAVLRFADGVEAMGLVRGGWAHAFTPRGLWVGRADMLTVERP